MAGAWGIRATVGAVLATGVALTLPAAASGQAGWRLEQPDPPAGAPFRVPLGKPGDLQCIDASRCLLSIEGNETVRRGLYFFDGVSWRPLSSVCGDLGAFSRIAWASPTEFWTVTAPSLPRIGSGTALCRIRDGQVIGSFSTPDESADPFRTMTSAGCNGPSDCWFGGIGSQDPSGARLGAFHLRWNGTDLRTVYGPQGRGVTDLAFFDGRWWETSTMGAGAEDRQTPVNLAAAEDPPVAVRVIEGESFVNVGPGGAPRAGVPAAGTELLASDTSGGELWFVGGGAASGPDAPREDSVARPPVAQRLVGGRPQEVPIPDGSFGLSERFVDVAVIPGQQAAWVAVQPYEDRDSRTARATVARIGADGSVQRIELPASGAGRGSAARIEMTGPNEGWMITTAGWLFHFTDDTPRAQTVDPAFARLIDFRPNEAAAQAVSDAPPPDDSLLFAPPPIPGPMAAMEAATETTAARRLRAALFGIRRPQVSRRFVLTLRFRARRTVRVSLRGLRRGRIVARTPLRTLRPGRRVLRMRLNRRRYPTALRFVVRETGRNVPTGPAAPPADEDTIVVGGGGETPPPPVADETVVPGGGEGLPPPPVNEETVVVGGGG